MICPNCSYKLVLLKSRSRYKCSLCSKLYPQKEIDNKEFRKYNNRQRKDYLGIFQLEFIKERNEARRRWRQDNREFFNKYAREYQSKNKEQINANRRGAYSKNRKQMSKKYKQWQLDNQHSYKMKIKLAFLRQKQKQLAIEALKTDLSKISKFL